MKTRLDYKNLITAANNGTIKDDLNPAFILSLTANDLLAKIASGEINIQLLAKIELANRGFDLSGKWVGFKQAEIENFK